MANLLALPGKIMSTLNNGLLPAGAGVKIVFLKVKYADSNEINSIGPTPLIPNR